MRSFYFKILIYTIIWAQLLSLFFSRYATAKVILNTQKRAFRMTFFTLWHFIPEIRHPKMLKILSFG